MANTGERTSNNQTMRHEQAKSSVGGNSPQGSDRSRETGQFDKKSDDKSAVGGGETRSQTGEPGRARDELDQKNKESVGSNQR